MDRVGIPDLSALKGATDIERLVKRARTPYSGSFDSQGWALVNKSALLLADLIVQSVPIVQTSQRLNEEMVRQGGLQITIGKGDGKNYDSDTLLGKTWLNWAASAVYPDQCKYGFALATYVRPPAATAALYSPLEDTFSEMNYEPRVLDVHQCDIYHKKNILGESMWVVCEAASGPGLPFALIDNPLQPRPIPNVYVFWIQCPDALGQPRSAVLGLCDKLVYLNRLRATALISAERRALPPIVTEHVNNPKEPEANGVPAYGNEYCGPTGDGKVDPEKQAKKAAVDAYMNRLVRFRNTTTADEQQVFAQYAALVANTMVHEQKMQAEQGAQIHLPYERKLARQLQSEPPGMELMRLEIHFEQEALLAHGIPPGMIQPESTHGKMVTNENAQVIYTQHMKTLKQDLVGPIEVLLRRIFTAPIVLKYAAQNRATRPRVQMQDLTITVRMFGIPPYERLLQYYQMGVLKYSALKRSLASIDCIPEEDFETFARLSVKDLLTKGKPDKPPAAAGTATKKRKRE
jgi:hypothetical protein